MHPLTPAEERTLVYSNRFAGHVLRYPQTFALMKERRWVTNYLGPWDSGYDGQARREFASHGLRAVFFHQPAADDGRYAVDSATPAPITLRHAERRPAESAGRRGEERIRAGGCSPPAGPSDPG